jgi:hypothetical protein
MQELPWNSFHNLMVRIQLNTAIMSEITTFSVRIGELGRWLGSSSMLARLKSSPMRDSARMDDGGDEKILRCPFNIS